MPKGIKISINNQLDYIQVEATYPDGRCLPHKRLNISNSSPVKEDYIMWAKAICFDLLWEYTEQGTEAFIHPYIN